MASGSAMVSNVGNKLNQTLSTTTKPSTTQVSQWLNDGQYELIRQLHPLLISELVVTRTPGIRNGTFDFDTEWTKGDAAITISSGKANWGGGQSGNADLSQDAGFVVWVTYEITFTVSGRSAGTIQLLVGTATGTTRSTNEEFTESVVCTGNTNIVFRGNSDFDGSIDDVSITAQTTIIKTGLPSNHFKPMRAFDNSDGEPLKLIGYPEYVEIKSGANSYLTTSSYVYTLGNDNDTDSIYYYPASDPSSKTFIYIKYPTAIANPGTSSEIFSLSDELIPYVVDYAVAQAYLQDDETQIYQTMLAAWYERIKIINQRVA